jgi:hypothetical protein
MIKVLGKDLQPTAKLLAQKTVFFQLIFTISVLQKVFGPSFKHNDLMLGNIRGTLPKWSPASKHSSDRATMAADIDEGTELPQTFFKYQLDG